MKDKETEAEMISRGIAEINKCFPTATELAANFAMAARVSKGKIARQPHLQSENIDHGGQNQ